MRMHRYVGVCVRVFSSFFFLVPSASKEDCEQPGLFLAIEQTEIKPTQCQEVLNMFMSELCFFLF